MIEHEKEQDNYGEIGDKVNDIHNVVREYQQNKDKYEETLEILKGGAFLIGGISAAMLIVSLIAIIKFVFLNDLSTPETNSKIFHKSAELWCYFGPLFFFSLNHKFFIPRLPLINHTLKKCKTITNKILNNGFSKQEQFNYLLFLDILIDKCPVNDLQSQIVQMKLMKLKNDIISVCDDTQKEKLISIIYENIDFLVDTSTELLNLTPIEKAGDNKEFKLMYEQFVNTTGLELKQYHTPLQKIKNVL